MVTFTLLLLSCSKDEPTPATAEAMDPVALLGRASLDLRGRRASDAEIAAVLEDPDAVDGLIDEFLRDPAFPERVVDLWSEIYLTYSEQTTINAGTLGIADYAGFQEAAGDEALRILARVAEEDLPWTEIVTADWTMMNETLAQALPTDYPDGATGWQVAHYLDGRPAAGVLSTSTMWWRYDSTDSNANRKRANTASRVLLCNDYLSRPIDFDRNVNLLDGDAVLDALKTNPACIACHVSLDPLAGYFYGFWTYLDGSAGDATEYHPEREVLWQTYTDVPPGFYGEPGHSLQDLGIQIASDNRFAECAVEQAYSLLLRRSVTLEDTDHLTNHWNAFLSGGLTLRSLVRSVVDDPNYRTGATEADGPVTLKMVTPDLLGSVVKDLTGFDWRYAGFDMLKSEMVGLRTLAGGADGYTVTANATSPNATLVLVQQRLAEAASDHAVENERNEAASSRRLFTEIGFTETPESDGEKMRRQIRLLHQRVLGNVVEEDGPEVEANLELWQSLYAVSDDPAEAWKGLLYALLRDPDFLFY
jgi:hypothetical protein